MPGFQYNSGAIQRRERTKERVAALTVQYEHLVKIKNPGKSDISTAKLVAASIRELDEALVIPLSPKRRK